MTSGTPASPPRPGRPPGLFFVLVIALVLVGVLAPFGVNRYMKRRAAAVPMDTTGNRPGAHPDTSRPDSSRGPQ